MKKIAALLSVLITLTACGFQPMYGDRPETSAKLHTISVNNIPDQAGQELRNHLIDRINPHGQHTNPRYNLNVTIAKRLVGSGIRKDATASWATLQITAQYNLVETATQKNAVSGSAFSSVGYSKLDAQYANLVSSENAEQRALKDLANQIATRLALFVGKQEP